MSNPSTFQAAPVDLFASPSVPAAEYAHVTVSGRFVHDRSVFVGPRMRDSPGGAQVQTPVISDDAT